MGSQLSRSIHSRRSKEKRGGTESHRYGSSTTAHQVWKQGEKPEVVSSSTTDASRTWVSSTTSTASTAPAALSPAEPQPTHGLAGESTSVDRRRPSGVSEHSEDAGRAGKEAAPSSHSAQTSRMAPATVPCQYRTGKTLGSGTYAIVKEAVQIKTGKYYACKVINKKLMEGREYMVRNEIAVLKKVSSGHRNIVTLHDYFETAHNLYLCFDLCTGGELFDRICAKGNYYEEDAAELVRTIMGAVKYIHECGIVHRDLKPENLLFRTKDEDADIMIADFGLSRVMDDEKFHLLTEICGTPGYMAPEIFKKTGHGKPVDVWAMGVITYFLLCGYTPFDRDTQQQEMEAIIEGDYHFEPAEYWANVSETAREFVSACLTIDPASRPTAAEALQHKWLASEQPHFVPDPESASGRPTNLLPNIRKAFDAKKTFRKAVFSMIATKRLSTLVGTSTSAQAFGANIAQFKAESEKEQVDEDRNVVHYDSQSDDSKEELKTQEEVSKAGGHIPLVSKMQNLSV